MGMLAVQPEKLETYAAILGAVSLIVLLTASFSLGIKWVPPQVDLSIASNPSGAQVYVEGRLKGSTPLTVQIAANREVSFRLVAQEPHADHRLYKPYEGKINLAESKSISIWLERTTPEEQQAERRAAEEERRVEQPALGQAPLLVERWHWHHNNVYAIAEGRVVNQGLERLENVEAVVEIYRADGSFVSAGSSPLDARALLSGQASAFEIYIPWNPAMHGAKLHFREARGERIPSMRQQSADQ